LVEERDAPVFPSSRAVLFHKGHLVRGSGRVVVVVDVDVAVAVAVVVVVRVRR
jgi:hypothetical protein